MWWLWIAGPLAVLAVYLLTAQTDQDRTAHEIDLWRRAMARRVAADRKKKEQKQKKAAPPGYRGKTDKKLGKHAKAAAKQGKQAQEKAAFQAFAPPELRAISAELMRMLDRTGGGTVAGHYELVPRLAYLSVLTAMSTMSSDQQTVVAKLGKPAPSFTVRPLPIIDGQRVANTGVKFKKDPEFMEDFLVQGANPKAIGKWLTRPLRDAMRELPEVWLFVEGKTIALTVYGRAEASRMEALVQVADEFFADYGAKGGPSLFGVDEDEDDEDEQEEEDTATDDEDVDDEDADDEDEDEEQDDDEGGETDEEDRPAAKAAR